ncbi:transcriptional regulator GcvA [Denitromonas halophila]|uniref:Transcriptional regulator GcvA n=2 Tax=Denitromonas halophila TaxID=1629404 RepID=A0A557QM05_9RHOO|nr:transcriptional regulator GcvA [Denitromonas halophila]
MSLSMPPLQSLRVFETAARHLSFKQAAEELHVTPAAVSQQIKALEAHLGVPLFYRLTRALALTEAGERMLPQVSDGLAQLAAAVEKVVLQTPSRNLRITVPPAFAGRWLVHRLQRFTEAHPDIDLVLGTEANTVDAPDLEDVESDLVALREGEVDVEIRFGRGAYPGMRTDLVMEVSYVPVCHPDLLKGKRRLKKASDLSFHTLLHDDTAAGRSERVSWQDWLRAAKVSGVDPSRGPHFSNSSLALEAAMDGFGVMLGLYPMVQRDIDAGRLVRPFDLAIPSRYAYYLVSPETTVDRPAIARFRQWLMAEI